jgi:hypothetical protein
VRRVDPCSSAVGPENGGSPVGVEVGGGGEASQDWDFRLVRLPENVERLLAQKKNQTNFEYFFFKIDQLGFNTFFVLVFPKCNYL